MAKKPTYLLIELAKQTSSRLIGDPNYLIEGVEEIEVAGPKEATFFENPRYERQLEQSKAGVLFVATTPKEDEKRNFLIHPNPSLAFQKVVELFIQPPLSGFLDIHPSAIIHREAHIGSDVSIAPHVVIDRGARIGDRTVIGPGVSIGADVTIGKQSHLYANVVVREGCHIGNRVVIQPGAVIGSSGFGYITDEKGNHHSLKQLGIVVIEDEVEIGANTTIDRARFKTTHIKRGTKIDNLVQIAHQVSLGENNLIVSQVGIAGSTKTGRNVVMGGQCGVNGHITLTDGVILAARSAVSKSLKKAGLYCGIPAMENSAFRKQFFLLRNLENFAKEFKHLKNKIAQYEKAPPFLIKCLSWWGKKRAKNNK